ncbi:MAG TPA: TetR family transcriptional regulator, partial [Acidimicrobiia bacterium]
MTASDARALDGRTIGKRGAETRRRLLDATAVLLRDRGVLELRVVDIARSVGTSSATYYQYFRDVDEAVLELADEIGARDVEPLARLLDDPWDAERGLAQARMLVERFIHVWDDHSAVLHTRNLAAQEGDRRFRETRNRTNRPFLEGFAAQVRAHQAEGRIAPDLSPMAAAAALMALIERMAACHSDLAALGVSRDDVVETTARIVFDTV